jgi:hypothetical protein
MMNSTDREHAMTEKPYDWATDHHFYAEPDDYVKEPDRFDEALWLLRRIYADRPVDDRVFDEVGAFLTRFDPDFER